MTAAGSGAGGAKSSDEVGVSPGVGAGASLVGLGRVAAGHSIRIHSALVDTRSTRLA